MWCDRCKDGMNLVSNQVLDGGEGTKMNQQKISKDEVKLRGDQDMNSSFCQEGRPEGPDSCNVVNGSKIQCCDRVKWGEKWESQKVNQICKVDVVSGKRETAWKRGLRKGERTCSILDFRMKHPSFLPASSPPPPKKEIWFCGGLLTPTHHSWSYSSIEKYKILYFYWDTHFKDIMQEIMQAH